jgi:hypothetical protein
MGDSLSSIVSPLTSVASTVLNAVENPIGTLLPMAEGLLTDASSSFVDGLVKQPGLLPEQYHEPVQAVLQDVVALPQHTDDKREHMLSILEKLLDVLEV